MASIDPITTIVFFNTFMAFAKNIGTLQSLAAKIGDALSNSSFNDEKTEEKIRSLTNNFEPSEHEIILLKLIFDRPDEFTMKDISQITKTRERIIEFHLGELSRRELVYDNSEDNSLQNDMIGWGITDKGIKFIHDLENQEAA
jgi:Fic family protein